MEKLEKVWKYGRKVSLYRRIEKRALWKDMEPKPELLLVKCHATDAPVNNASYFVQKKLEIDNFIKQYFPKFVPLYAYDPEHMCRVGDIVLVQKMEPQKYLHITHKVLQVVYPLGDVVDPVSNKPCVAGLFREDMEKMDQLWGKNENAFDYNKAPPRGWQEGRKDFSHRKPHKRWHDFKDRNQDEALWP